MNYTKELPVRDHYDVIVCGGGFSGFASAYAAAREGARVLLIERNAFLGGVGTGAMVNHILGVRAFENDRICTCVGDVFRTLEARLLETGSAVDVHAIDFSCNPHGWNPGLGLGLIFNCEQMKLLLEQMLREVGATVLYYTDLVDAVTEDGRIRAVIVHNKSGLYALEADLFIDATGDADLCQAAGGRTVKGDENEEMAAASLEMHVENVDTDCLTAYMRETGDVRFRALIAKLKESGEWTFPYEIFISVQMTRRDVYMINTIRQVGVDGTDAVSLTQAVLDGRRENFRLLEIMRAHFPGFANATIRQIAPTVGIRETTRIVSDYTLTVADLIDGTDFPDGIALSGYGWDLPNPKHPSHQPFHGVKRRSPYTQIPYRCLLPEGQQNLLVVGRCIGVEREVLGPVRVMGPCIAMGTAAGIAAKLALDTDCCFRKVNTEMLRETIVARGGMVDRTQIQK